MYAFEKAIRTIPDFPSAGIAFKDIAPLLAEPAHFSEAIHAFKERFENESIDVIVGIESRGFIFASALAYAMNCGVIWYESRENCLAKYILYPMP